MKGKRFAARRSRILEFDVFIKRIRIILVMEVTRTEIIIISTNESLGDICHLAKNLYNKANYHIRQHFFTSNKILTYHKTWQKTKILKEYKNLPAQTAQQVLRMLIRNWKSFHQTSLDYGNNPRSFFVKPKIPAYKKRNGEYTAIFTNQQVKILEDGKLKFPKIVKIDLKTRLNSSLNLREIRVVPLGVGYRIEIVYKKIVSKVISSSNRIAAIDLGCINIITLVDNIGTRPIILKDDGKGIKSIIQYYMKEKAKLQKRYSDNGVKTGLKLSKLNLKFKNKIKDYLHKLSRTVINHCCKLKIGKLVIGQNIGWKQQSMMSKKQNQMFINIPFSHLVQLLKYKGKEQGIIVMTIEEKYTSKCSFLDNESIEHHNSYSGRRVKRGLFQSSSGIVINSDVNAAYNILIKSEPKALPFRSVDGVGGYVVNPLRLSINI